MTSVRVRDFPRILAVGFAVIAASAGPSIARAQTTFDGVVVFANVVELRAGVSGVVDLDAPAPGGTFEAGHVIASVSSPYHRARLDSAERRAGLARAELDEAQRAFERDQVLYDEGSLSQVDFDRAALQLTGAMAAAAQAESELVGARSAAGLSRLAVPFDGVVLDVAARDGVYLNASIEAPLVITVAQRGRLAARLSVGGDDRRAIRLGNAAKVTVDGRAVDGVVGAIRYAGPEAPAPWLVDVMFDTVGESIVAGQKARVELP